MNSKNLPGATLDCEKDTKNIVLKDVLASFSGQSGSVSLQVKEKLNKSVNSRVGERNANFERERVSENYLSYHRLKTKKEPTQRIRSKLKKNKKGFIKTRKAMFPRKRKRVLQTVRKFSYRKV